MKKNLHKSLNKCPSGCLYCFAEMESYQLIKSKVEVFNSESLDSCDIIYPSCDSEFILDLKLQKEILNNITNKTVVSVSTKSSISDRVLKNLISINNKLKASGGFLKVSVSISTKSMVDIIEPRTSSYLERLETIKLLSSNKIFCSINLKPILPTITLLEYMEIVDDSSKFVDDYLIGGLYVDQSCINEKLVSDAVAEPSEYRKVNWLPMNTEWLYFEDKNKTDALKKYITGVGKNWYDSDTEFLESICGRSA